jgi:acyl-CoA reductase-like NAD-dependent aldehyde dehydrogenase
MTVESTKQFSVRNPRTGEMDYHFDIPGKADIASKTQSLRAAQGSWAALSIDERREALLRWAQELEKSSDKIIAALTDDTGRVNESGLEVNATIDAIKRWCGVSSELFSESEVKDSSLPWIKFTTEHVPYQLVGVISPWNLPLLLALIDAVPALLCGCSVIIKPSEVTPRFIEPLLETIAAVPGLCDVITLVAGDGATGAALIENVDMVIFTGSTATGKKVLGAAAEHFIPVFLELGGKDPAVVLASADIKRSAAAIAWGGVTNAGQACQSIERVYVDQSIYQEFVTELAAAVKTIPLNTNEIAKGLGPIIAGPQADILADHLADAKKNGATIHCGGEIQNVNGGLWCEPTVLTDVDHQMKIMSEETFGPLIPVMPFNSDEEAATLANDTKYGLSAAVFAGTTEEAMAFAKQLEVGAVSINDCSLTAFVHDAEKQSFKASGMGGSRMGAGSIKRFFRAKANIMNVQQQWNPWWFHSK